MKANILTRNSYRISAFLLSAAILPFTLSGCGNPAYLELGGTLEASGYNVTSEVAGKITELKKDEGDKVARGDVVAIVDSANQQLSVRQQEAAVKLKTARLEELTAGTRPEQLQQAEIAVKSAEIAVKSAKTGVDSAQTSYAYLLEKYNNAKSLRSSGSISDDLLLDAKYKLDIAAKQLDSAKKQQNAAQEQLNSAKTQLSLLKSGSTSQSIKAAQADLEQSQAALDLARLQLSKYEIKAPAEGILSVKNVSTGDMAVAGTNIASLSDLSKLWINIYVPQSQLGRITLGQTLDIRVTALKGKTIKGKVAFIASEAEFTPKNIETTEAKENTVFKVKISLEPGKENLRPGMTADALIPLK